MSLLIEIDDNFSNVKVRMTTNDARFSVVVEHLAPGQTSTTGVEVGVPLSLGYDEGGGSCRNSDMHPTQRLSLFRYGSRRDGLEDFMRASGMDSTRDIRTSRGARLVCSTVAPRRERDDRCLSLRRSFSFAPIDPN